MRKGLLISTMLVSVAGLGASAEAANQCLQTPSCESLGYTQTSCVDNNGVKCPFGNKYFCVCPAKYAYSCSDTGYAGGSGTSCGGKYAECTCTSGYIWENGSCVQNAAVWGQCTGYATQCSLGDILFSDGTCASDVVSGKTPIAVVVYISSEGCGQAMALNSIGDSEWGGYGTDISGLTNYTSKDTAATDTAATDYASCENSKIIMAAGDKSKYPAVWAANEYSTEGTSAGDWCLPAAGIFNLYYKIKKAINTGFSRANGTQFTADTRAWSSSEYNNIRAWYSYFNYNFGLDYSSKDNYAEVRPVIEF